MATYSKRGYRLGRPPLTGWRKHVREQQQRHQKRVQSLEVFDSFCEAQRVRILREFHDPFGKRFQNKNNALSRQTDTETRIDAESRDFLRAKQRVMALGPELHYSEPTEVIAR